MGLHSLRAQAAFNALGTLQEEVDELNSPKLKNADTKFQEAFGRLSSLQRLSHRMRQARLHALAEKPAGEGQGLGLGQGQVQDQGPRATLQQTWQRAPVEFRRGREGGEREWKEAKVGRAAALRDSIALPPYTR